MRAAERKGRRSLLLDFAAHFSHLPLESCLPHTGVVFCFVKKGSEAGKNLVVRKVSMLKLAMT